MEDSIVQPINVYAHCVLSVEFHLPLAIDPFPQLLPTSDGIPLPIAASIPSSLPHWALAWTRATTAHCSCPPRRTSCFCPQT